MLEVPGYSGALSLSPPFSCVHVDHASATQPCMHETSDCTNKAQYLRNKILCQLHGATCASGLEDSRKGALQGGNVSLVVGVEQQSSKAFLASKQQWVSCRTNPWITPRARAFEYIRLHQSAQRLVQIYNL